MKALITLELAVGEMTESPPRAYLWAVGNAFDDVGEVELQLHPRGLPLRQVKLGVENESRDLC